MHHKGNKVTEMYHIILDYMLQDCRIHIQQF